MSEEPKTILKYAYPSLIKAQKKYYEKMKHTETFKENQKRYSKNYYEKNKEMIRQKNKESYHKKKELANLQIN